MRLRGAVTQIDDDQIAFVLVHPSPRQEILITPVVRPTRSLAQAPLALTKGFVIDGFHEHPVEPKQILIDRLIGAPTQKYGQPHFATFKLSFME